MIAGIRRGFHGISCSWCMVRPILGSTSSVSLSQKLQILRGQVNLPGVIREKNEPPNMLNRPDQRVNEEKGPLFQ